MRRQRGNRKTRSEIERIVAGFEPSGLTRAGYAEMQGITVAALDSYRRRVRRRAEFVEVALAGGGSETFAIASASGWRIEIGWSDIGRAAAHSEQLRAVIESLERG